MEQRPAHPGAAAGANGAETLDSLWRQFGGATSEREFCSSWLALQCRVIADVDSGVVMLEGAEDRPSTFVASWPADTRDFTHLGDVAQRALKERRGLALKRQIEDTRGNVRTSYDIAYPVHVSGRLYGVVALNIHSRPETALREAMRQLQWGSAWMEVLCHRRQSSVDDAPRERIQAVLTLMTSVVSSRSFHGATVALATALATRFDCDRVSIGFVRRGSIRLEAMSHTGEFGAGANVVRAIEAAMNEAADQEASVVFPSPAEGRALVTRAHSKLSAESGNPFGCTVLLSGHERLIGAITLERGSDHGEFDPEALAVCESLGGLAGPVLETHRKEDRWLIRKAVESAAWTCGALIGRSYVAAKLLVTGLVVLAIVLSQAKATYRVTADTVVEPSTQQSVVAAFDGYIRTASLRAGDLIQAGQELATLDDRDWQLERNRWQSEEDQSRREYLEALGKGNPSQAQISSAKMAQARAQVALLNEHISRTRITAPFDGVIVMGDLSQSLGSPVQRGQLLFEVAPLDSYRVILEVDERDIARLQVGQKGQLALSGFPDDPLPFEVKRISPVSTASEGRNYFRVEAQLQIAPERLRPGMEGVGKVEIEERLLVWIWTHQAIDWVRLKIWNWLP